MVFGILTLVLSWIPFFDLFSTGLFGLLGLIFSIVGIAKSKNGGRGKAIAGLVLTILGVIVTVVCYVLIASYVTNGLNNLDEDTIYSWIEELEEMDDLYDTSYNADNSGIFIDGDYVTGENGYISGVLHIDTYQVVLG